MCRDCRSAVWSVSAQSAEIDPVIVNYAHLGGNIDDLVNAPITPYAVGQSGIQNTTFNLTYGPGLASNPQAQAAFNQAAARWSALMQDCVTLKIYVDYQPLGTGILGQSNATYYIGGYTTVRNLVANGGEAGDTREAALLPNLPTVGQFSAWLPSGFHMNDGKMILTSANYKALGGSPPDTTTTSSFPPTTPGITIRATASRPGATIS